jgi:hypothetical protein
MAMKKLMVTAAFVAALAIPSAASASVNVDANGYGFIGKGDVQTALNLNNDLLQKNASNIAFNGALSASQAMTQDAKQTATQDMKQTGSQSGTQIGTQSATQSVVEVLTCLKENGNKGQQLRYGTRDAERAGTRSATRSASRDGERTGSRDGQRLGIRNGVINGVVNAELNGDPRQTKGQNQFTGFNMKGFLSQSPFVATGTTVWNAPTFNTGYSFGGYKMGDWSFGDWSSDADYSFGDYTYSNTITWGEWEKGDPSDPNSGGADGVCKEGASNIVFGSVHDDISYGDVSEGQVVDGSVIAGEITAGDATENAVEDGDITYGPEQAGAVTKGSTITMTYALKGTLITK